MSSRRSQIKAEAARLQVEAETSNPGDGVRRYHFTLPSGSSFTAHGVREAGVFLRGFRLGQDTKFQGAQS